MILAWASPFNYTLYCVSIIPVIAKHAAVTPCENVFEELFEWIRKAQT